MRSYHQAASGCWPFTSGSLFLGTLGVFILAILSGIGGPPSDFRTGVDPLLAALGEHLIAIYVGGVGVAFLGLLLSVAQPRVGRVVSTAGAALSALGNILSAAIGSGGEGNVAFTQIVMLAPFMALMWRPGSAKGRGGATRTTGFR